MRLDLWLYLIDEAKLCVIERLERFPRVMKTDTGFRLEKGESEFWIDIDKAQLRLGFLGWIFELEQSGGLFVVRPREEGFERDALCDVIIGGRCFTGVVLGLAE